MFDLEKAIGEWQERLIAAGVKTPVPLDELESHLREQIERLMRTGMDAKMSFEAAIEKIGVAKDLQIEFSKVEKQARAAKEVKFVLALSRITVAFIAAAIGALVFFRVGSFSDLTSAQQKSGYFALSLMLLFDFGGWFGYRVFPSFGRKKIRDAICISAGVAMALWWVVLFWGILPRHDYTMAELLTLIVWGFVMPFGMMVGLCGGIETAARKSVASDS